jgi:hypothetical protein
VNDASVTRATDGVHMAGDPTETALLILALKAGVDGHAPPTAQSAGATRHRFGVRTLAEAAVLAAGVLSVHFWILAEEGAGPRATTVAFMTPVLMHPLQAMRCRSERARWWRLPWNPLSWVALGMLVALQ